MFKRKAIIATMVVVATGLGWAAWRSVSTAVRPVRRAQPVLTPLLIEHAGRIDYADAWTTPIRDGEPDEPAAWVDAAMAPQPIAEALMRIRDALVHPLGLKTAADEERPDTGFPVLAENDHEIVMGVDDKHLSFRVGITTFDAQATLTTTVTIANWFGKCYWAVVRWFHPLIVAAGLRKAHF